MTGIASITPLDVYPGLTTHSGLVLDQLLDVSGHSVRKTLECVLAGLSGAVVPEVAEIGAASEAPRRAEDGVEQFDGTPGIGCTPAVVGPTILFADLRSRLPARAHPACRCLPVAVRLPGLSFRSSVGFAVYRPLCTGWCR
ncbi:hypothetical protein [Streptomyces sp. NBRC 110035]|uniref:hypothetical protein n=1 Tax=Streptomyces sp. NBRC 110035 TaxID=1547867 RepID=UPI0005AA30BF|nr:hypothetical protein [Streptomyces sp. NBRC 110035]